MENLKDGVWSDLDLLKTRKVLSVSFRHVKMDGNQSYINRFVHQNLTRVLPVAVKTEYTVIECMVRILMVLW